ncbi:hypothetical protein MPSEU_000751700 [Mayamaea pseudoterrestris]|nr:hypothetical protein MPSEU_000751700 [Mayamaea pseudoterrestris]
MRVPFNVLSLLLSLFLCLSLHLASADSYYNGGGNEVEDESDNSGHGGGDDENETDNQDGNLNSGNGGGTTTTTETSNTLTTNSSNVAGSCPFPTDARTLTDGLDMREVVNPSTGTISVQFVYQGEAWVGFGVNPDGEMVGGDAVIGLPDEGSVQQYDLKGEGISFVTPWTTQTLLNASVTQQDGVTTMTFTMPLLNEGQNPIAASGPNTFLYAIGSSNELGYHRQRHAFTIDNALQSCDTTTGVTPTYAFSSSAIGDSSGSSGASDESEQESLRTRRLWMAHGLLMTISWGILAPVAIGCSVLRKALGGGGTWFVLHSNLNTLVFLTTTAGFAIAVYVLTKEGDKPFSEERHNKLGLVVFLLLFIQVMTGWFRPHLPKHSKAAIAEGEHDCDDDHAETGAAGATTENNNENAYEQSTTPKKSSRRVAFEIGHRIIGTGLLGLSWYQIYLGIELYDDEYGMSFNGNAVFFGVAGTIVGLIILGKVGMVGWDRCN